MQPHDAMERGEAPMAAQAPQATPGAGTSAPLPPSVVLPQTQEQECTWQCWVDECL